MAKSVEVMVEVSAWIRCLTDDVENFHFDLIPIAKPLVANQYDLWSYVNYRTKRTSFFLDWMSYFFFPTSYFHQIAMIFPCFDNFGFEGTGHRGWIVFGENIHEKFDVFRC